jgi:hypothetical protein
MNANHCLGALTFFTLLSSSGTPSRAAGVLPALAFEELSLHLEIDLPASRSSPRSALVDLPVEIVIGCTSPASLARLRVIDPSRRTVLELDLRDRGACGLSEIEVESEAPTLRAALRDYPPGDYLVEAVAIDGAAIAGRVSLSARFPGVFEVLSPAPDATVPEGDVRIEWTASAGAARYLLEIEQEELGLELKVELGAGETSFDVPAAVLQPGRAYEYSLAVQGDTDNELEVEGRFVTAAQGR